MRKYIRIVISYILIWGLVIAGLNGLFWTNYHYSFAMMQEMYQHTENIDVLFLGSSHTYCSYDPNLADNLLGVETFNAGSSVQTFFTSYYLLKEIEKQNRVDTVYLDTYYAISKAKISENEASIYRISDYMKWSWNKVELLWNIGAGNGFLNGVLCSCKRNFENTDIRKNIKSRSLVIEEFPKKIEEFAEYRGKGFVYNYVEKKTECPDLKKFAESYDLTGEMPMSSDSYEYLIKIIDYCKENDIDLVLVDQPMPDELLSEIKGYDNYVAFLSRLSAEYGIDYMNFNLCKGYEKSLSDYFDAHHLNGPAAEKYTRIFCETVNDLKNQEKTMDDFFYQEYSPADYK